MDALERQWIKEDNKKRTKKINPFIAYPEVYYV